MLSLLQFVSEIFQKYPKNIDLQEEDDLILSNDDVVAREEAKVVHASPTLNLARKWGQRAKEDWAKDAEKNSKYHHQLGSYKYSCSNINFLLIGDAMCYDKDVISVEAKYFYSSLFSEEHVVRPEFDDIILPSISVADIIDLEKPFTKVEVKNEIWNFRTNKSLGYDGFTVKFFKAVWEIIKDDLMKVVKEFEGTASLDRILNCTTLKLIPKKIVLFSCIILCV